MTITLTTSQRRYLREVKEADERGEERTYNGRARKPLEALRTVGLVQYEFELVPVQNGRFTERFICHLDANYCEACAGGMGCAHQVRTVR